MMRGRVVPLNEITNADTEAWAELAERAAEPNPLFEPGCLLAARHLVNADRIRLVIAEDDSGMLGCFPVQVEKHWRAFPVAVAANTHVRRMQYDGTPLLDRDHTAAAAATLMRAASAPGSGLPRVLANDWVADGGPVTAAFAEAALETGRSLWRYQEWERPVAYRRENADFLADHSSHMRANVRRRMRAIKKDFGHEPVLVDCTQDPQMIERLIELEGMGYKGRDGIAISQHPGEHEWFVEMCDRFRAQGRLRLMGLMVGAEAVAFQLLLRGGDGWLSLKILFDERYRRYGPGVRLIFDALTTVFTETDARWIDTCTYSGNDTLLRFFPDRRAVVSLVTTPDTWADRRLFDAVARARKVKDGLAQIRASTESDPSPESSRSPDTASTT